MEKIGAGEQTKKPNPTEMNSYGNTNRQLDELLKKKKKVIKTQRIKLKHPRIMTMFFYYDAD